MNRFCRREGYTDPSLNIGQLFDGGHSLDDLKWFYYVELGSSSHRKMREDLFSFIPEKGSESDRNKCHWMQQGGQNEPYNDKFEELSGWCPNQSSRY